MTPLEDTGMAISKTINSRVVGQRTALTRGRSPLDTAMPTKPLLPQWGLFHRRPSGGPPTRQTGKDNQVLRSELWNQCQCLLTPAQREIMAKLAEQDRQDTLRELTGKCRSESCDEPIYAKGQCHDCFLATSN